MEQTAPAAPPEPAPGRGRAKRGAATPWWHALEQDDAITLEPLCELPYPPFELPGGTDDAGAQLPSSFFDGRALAEYLAAARLFANPLSRRPLSREDTVRLDFYLKKHRLGREFTVLKDFDAEAERRAAAAAAGTGEALAAERAATAAALLNAFFASRHRQQARPAGPSGAVGQPAHLQAEGNFALLDDDAGMTRGVTRAAAEATAAAERAAAAPREAFPALPPQAQPRPEAWPALPAARSEGPRGSGMQPQWWALASAPPPRPPPSRPPPDPAAAASAQRRAQLAAAFGVDQPDARPSMFAATAAATFSMDVLTLARSDPALVLVVESRLDAALAARARRTSLPAMPRLGRKLAHEAAERYGMVSSSYGEGASRHVDVFVLPTSGHPAARLSDAVKAPPEAVAALLEAQASAEAEPAEGIVRPPAREAVPERTEAPSRRQLTTRFLLRFEGTAPPLQRRGAQELAEASVGGDGVVQWQSLTDGTVSFASESAMRDTAARLRDGGALRGLFKLVETMETVVAPKPAPAMAPPPAEPAAAAEPKAPSAPHPAVLAAQRRAAAEAERRRAGSEDPWTGDRVEQRSAEQPRRRRSPPPPERWDAAPARSRNQWALLGDEGEGGDD